MFLSCGSKEVVGRDLTWSRHQLEELAERRFLAAQQAAKLPHSHVPGADEIQLNSLAEADLTSFQDLFKKVAHTDFSSYLAKLSVRHSRGPWQRSDSLDILGPGVNKDSD